LIPESNVIAEFEKFQAEAPDSLTGRNSFLPFISFLHSFNFVVDFIDYFEDNYVGRPIRGGRRRCPRFSILMWNCFSRLNQQLPRTNNSAEGWNKAIKVGLISDISVLQTDQSRSFRIVFEKIHQSINVLKTYRWNNMQRLY
jgi:hypothetical protein